MVKPKDKKKSDLSQKLRGIDAISKYIGFSIPTVMGWIQKENFPATRTQGETGIYISSTTRVDKWWDEKIKSREKRRW